MPVRHRDRGERLDHFVAGDVGDEVLVRCPGCGGRAVARPDPRGAGGATLTCAACGLARRRAEPEAAPRDRRCPRCERWIPASAWAPAGDGRRHDARCPRCGNVVRAAIEAWSTLTGAPVDPWFREPLWLQAPCAGELLWAYNRRHLEHLAAIVGATLRERPGRPGGNASMLSRLPRWMKAAKHREEVLRAIAALRRRWPLSPAR
ncbi:MAG: hypothetical protein QM704_06410 [Anaeromyxobacteraceae bacterium]